MLAVIDEGIGIAEKDLDTVFDRFYRVDEARVRKNGGSGLGLAIAKQIVRNHQGEIQVKSQVNEGSVFTVTIPMQKAGEVN
ncbi:sensor histidine kinase [Salisediminibacterium beveridgei]|uniref:histidine kinase n=1 Tax=Salisediminibacterium beveridgei TaxID=632773 RepID=A0A1D7QY93_9BACI|nr:ATP-binding protein [Salisediminibacterium beveridgei]AOM83974.1 Sensor histidine kinase yycG [Salisediminibacterium beveridgei]